MNYIVSGGTGFVGQHLVSALEKEGNHIFVLTRNPKKHTNSLNITFIDFTYPGEKLPPIEGVVNLAGESLFGYWTKEKKKKILESRINTTQKVVHLMETLQEKPRVFISGSAIGFYGVSEDLIFTEASTEPGNDFLADVVVKWENEARKATDLGIRTVFTRFGVILGKDNGALPFMTLPVKWFAGGKLGNGEQWMSWVHVEDVVRMIRFCMDNESIQGPINVTAPNPKRNIDFMKTLTKTIKRPFWFHTPSPLLNLVTGEMSQLILKGQYVLPRKAEDHQYSFSYPYLEEALQSLLKDKDHN
ncbi:MULTISPECIES: TIGR01777 family oxidoreductase [unclassified Virgibacillus]|uniref:TIGR01777 family oxidoreductase n=1 Tax=unclassified Virgibacillus TaxID=2620237 RepID=UPI0024DE84F6|nr:TIGR01777 family oxidoreductase [Virgibacillus sp. LDC-1]